jgi:glutamate/tyrosine decarboxylase-like PLP-dependent enzyme
MSLEAAYYAPNPAEARANHHFVPESSRRARCFSVYAALRSLGRSGLIDLVERCSALAQRMADRLSRHARIHVLNDVVLNQVLVRIEPPSGDTSESAIDAFTALVVNRIQEDGTCWLGGSIWQGEYVMRIAVSNWSTSEEDIDRSADAIIRCST